MTLMGKIFVLVNLALSLAFMYMAITVYGQRVDLRGQIEQKEKNIADLRSQKTELDQTNQRLTGEQGQLQANLDKLKQDKDKMESDLRERNSSLETEVSELRKREGVAKVAQDDAIQTANQRTEEVNSLRGDRDKLISEKTDLLTERGNLQDDLAKTQAKLEIVETRAKELDNRARELENYVFNLTGKKPTASDIAQVQDKPAPPIVEGVVTKKSENGRFVQISIGSDDGLVVGHQLELWRPGANVKYLGKIEIVSVKPDVAVARPVGFSGASIMPNDRVDTTLKASKTDF